MKMPSNPLSNPLSNIDREKLLAQLRRAADIPHDATLKSAQKLVRSNPQASPAQLVAIENARYLRRVSAESGAVGAAAAYPGAGTAIAAGITAGQLAAFVGETAAHALVVAHLYGLDLRDPVKRNSLVLAALTGKAGVEVVEQQLGVNSIAWFRSAFLTLQSARTKQINQMMLKWASKKMATRMATSSIGRLAPFGIGAAVGWTLGRSMGKQVISSLTQALGAPPEQRPVPEVIDVIDVEVREVDPEDLAEDVIVAEVDPSDATAGSTRNARGAR